MCKIFPEFIKSRDEMNEQWENSLRWILWQSNILYITKFKADACSNNIIQIKLSLWYLKSVKSCNRINIASLYDVSKWKQSARKEKQNFLSLVEFFSINRDKAHEIKLFTKVEKAFVYFCQQMFRRIYVRLLLASYL